MPLALQVVADAERQIREASDWWRANRAAARGLFRSELTRGFELITSQPWIGTAALDSDLEGVRRLHLPRVRYSLYYRVYPDEAVEVLVFWHMSREAGPPL